MKQVNIRLMAGMVALLWLMVAAGCATQADEPAMPGSEVGITASFTLVSGSRATPGGSYDPGDGLENEIGIERGDFRFYFFDYDDTYVAELKVTAIVPTGGTAHYKTYNVLASCRADLRDRQLKVVAVANLGAYPALTAGKTTLARLWEMSLAAFAPECSQLADDRLIPLYGVRELGAIAWDSNNYASLGTVHMLRAYAKVEVRDDPETTYRLEGVSMTRWNTRYYAVPRDVTVQGDYVAGDYSADYGKAFTPAASGYETGLSLPFARSGGSWIVYVPEYLNTGRSDDDHARIALKFEDIDETYFIDFMDYAGNGGYFDLKRNYWYRFSVVKDNDNIEINPRVTVQVVPYAEYDIDVDFGLESPDGDWIPIYDHDGKLYCYYDPDTGMYYSAQDRQPMDNPFLAIDPGTGWHIIRDLDTGQLLYYYDAETGQFYDPDRRPVDNPYD